MDGSSRMSNMVLVYFQFTNTDTRYTEIQIHSYTEIQIHSYCVIEAIEQQTFAQSPRFICSSFKNPICSKAFDIYLIFLCVILFGFGTANFLGIVLREGVKAGKEPLGLTVSNLLTMGFFGFIFGPALVGYSAEYLGLTFNMYILCLVWFLNSCLLIYIKK